MSDPVGTVRPGGGGSGWRVKVSDNPRRWVPADVMAGPNAPEYVIAWDCTPLPARHQPCGVTREEWSTTADGRRLRIVLAVELYPLHDRTLPVASGPMVRATDPQSSRWAARAVADPARLTADQILALWWHYVEENGAAGGLTDFELAECTNRLQTSLGKRRGELERAGLVEFTGNHRPSPSGSSARVYRITERGYNTAALSEPRGAA